MRISRWFTLFALTAGLLFFSACASTSVKSVWKDPQYTAKLDKLLVIGVAKDEGIRRTFEDRMVSLLSQKGVEATPSYRVIPADEIKDKAAVEAKIRESGSAAVLVTRVVDVRKEKQFIPPSYAYAPPRHYYGGWHDYYTWAYPATPGYTVEYETLALETNVYDVASGKLVWSARSDAYAEEGVGKLIESHTGDMIARLVSSGLIH